MIIFILYHPSIYRVSRKERTSQYLKDFSSMIPTIKALLIIKRKRLKFSTKPGKSTVKSSLSHIRIMTKTDGVPVAVKCKCITSDKRSQFVLHISNSKQTLRIIQIDQQMQHEKLYILRILVFLSCIRFVLNDRQILVWRIVLVAKLDRADYDVCVNSNKMNYIS